MKEKEAERGNTQEEVIAEVLEECEEKVGLIKPMVEEDEEMTILNQA